MQDAGAASWLSPEQKHAWSVRSDTGSTANAVALVRLSGPLDPEKLRQAIVHAANRHEILRTVFRRHAGMRIPFQVVLGEMEPALEFAASASQSEDFAALFAAKRTRPLSLEQGPVLQSHLLRISAEQHVLILTLPEFCTDMRALRDLVKEIGLLYADRGQELNQEPLQYRQFAQWRNDVLEGDDPDSIKGTKFWQQVQAGCETPIALPLCAENRRAFQKESLVLPCGSALIRKIESTQKHRGDVLLAAWQSFLWRLSGQASFLVSVYFEGRNVEELDGALGPIGSFVPLPARFVGDLRFDEVLDAVHKTVAEAEQRLEYYSAPAARILPLGFSYEETKREERYGGVTFRIEKAEAGGEPYTLKLAAERQDEHLILRFEYDGAKLSAAAVQRFSEEFQTLLKAGLETPQERVSRLALLGEAERQCLLKEWNQTAEEYPAERSFPELFEEQVERTPERAAVRGQGRQFSYRELNERANRLARYLRQCGAGADRRVGLCMEPSAEQMVALLAILKAGAAYVALNAGHPVGRLAQQLQGVVAVLADDSLAGKLPEMGGKVVRLQADEAAWGALPDGNLATSAGAENLVYVIYTSGSTGTPKGVQVRHRNLVNYAYAVRRRLGWDQVAEGMHFATVSTLGADLGNTCIYPAWLSGGCVHVVGPEVATDSQAFGRYCTEEKIDVLKIVPAHLRALLDAGGGREILPRRYLVLGGEILAPALVERITALGGGCEIVNHYGPTETTVGSLALPLNGYAWQGSGARSIPIGRPLGNTRVYVLDAQGQLAPIGAEGELYIAGAGVTAGYLEQPEQTAASFLDDPFSGVEGGQMYRTGDRVRYLPTGEIEFVGRVDEQVKIRGHRVEPGEIEAVLGRHPGVRQAVVLARVSAAGETQLVGYIVSRAEPAVEVTEIQRYLKQELPDYMAPAAVVLLAKLPLTANGKLDRQALPTPEAAAAQSRLYEPPQTEIEHTLAAIWEQVLRRERIGRLDNFFEIGGHSLLATQIISRVRDHFGASLAVRALFDHPTIASFSLILATPTTDPDELDEELVPISRDSFRFTGGSTKNA
jgi:amino acid adenylation domain-containing protein